MITWIFGQSNLCDWILDGRRNSWGPVIRAVVGVYGSNTRYKMYVSHEPLAQLLSTSGQGHQGKDFDHFNEMVAGFLPNPSV